MEFTDGGVQCWCGLQDLYYFGCLLLLFMNFVLQALIGGRVFPSRVGTMILDIMLMILYVVCLSVFHAYYINRVYHSVCLSTCITIRCRLFSVT